MRSKLISQRPNRNNTNWWQTKNKWTFVFVFEYIVLIFYCVSFVCRSIFSSIFHPGMYSVCSICFAFFFFGCVCLFEIERIHNIGPFPIATFQHMGFPFLFLFSFSFIVQFFDFGTTYKFIIIWALSTMRTERIKLKSNRFFPMCCE